MNILLWVLQALLAAAFLAHGLLFLFPPAGNAGADEMSSRQHSGFFSAWPKCWPRSD